MKTRTFRTTVNNSKNARINILKILPRLIGAFFLQLVITELQKKKKTKITVTVYRVNIPVFLGFRRCCPFLYKENREKKKKKTYAPTRSEFDDWSEISKCCLQTRNKNKKK